MKDTISIFRFWLKGKFQAKKNIFQVFKKFSLIFHISQVTQSDSRFFQVFPLATLHSFRNTNNYSLWVNNKLLMMFLQWIITTSVAMVKIHQLMLTYVIVGPPPSSHWFWWNTILKNLILILILLISKSLINILVTTKGITKMQSHSLHQRLVTNTKCTGEIITSEFL